jgi:DNA-binding transcriptional MocR family regulator
MKDHRPIADALAEDIAAGRVRAGERLPPQREFADQQGIAVSTASRVYAELVRRGLVIGEVGRGTFVRSTAPVSDAGIGEPGDGLVDLEFNVPMAPGQARLMARALTPLLRSPAALEGGLHPVPPAGHTAARRTASRFLSRRGWRLDPDTILFTGNGKQAVGAAIAALVAPGERLGVERLSYPVVKRLAARLGIHLVPLAMDQHGLDPDALARVHRRTPLRAVYCQPTLHNPLGLTMTRTRREEVAAVLRRYDLVAVEDRVYGFLAADTAPLAQSAPDHTIVADSLSKRLAPGLSLGMVAAPARLVVAVSAAIRSGAWSSTGFALEACTRLMADGTVATIVAAKQRDAAERQRVLRQKLAGLLVEADPRAYHAWLTLPAPWRADTFVAAAASRGIAITPAVAFAVVPGHAPNAVRIALASPAISTLSSALQRLSDLARLGPGEWNTE